MGRHFNFNNARDYADLAARQAIIADKVQALPKVMGEVDVAQIGAATEGLTGADLKQLMEDGKILYAYDRSQSRPVKTATEYFLSAVATVKANRERYATAEATARAHRPTRPPWFDMPDSGPDDDCGDC